MAAGQSKIPAGEVNHPLSAFGNDHRKMGCGRFGPVATVSHRPKGDNRLTQKEPVCAPPACAWHRVRVRLRPKTPAGSDASLISVKMSSLSATYRASPLDQGPVAREPLACLDCSPPSGPRPRSRQVGTKQTVLHATSVFALFVAVPGIA